MAEDDHLDALVRNFLTRNEIDLDAQDVAALVEMATKNSSEVFVHVAARLGVNGDLATQLYELAHPPVSVCRSVENEGNSCRK